MDDKQLHDLLNKIEAPEPDEASKTYALNAAESAFKEKRKKNEKNHQGNVNSSRPTGVIRNIHNLIGDLTMKKAYIALGSVAIGGVLLSGTFLNNQDLIRQQPVVTDTMPAENDSAMGSVLGKLAGAVGLEEEVSRPRKSIATERKESSVARQEPIPVRAPTPPPVPAATSSSQNYKPEMDAGMAMSDMAVPSSPPVRMKSRAMVAQESIMPYPHPQPDIVPPQQYEGRDKFEEIKDNPVKRVKDEPVSTMSVDVDTASYSFVRRALDNGYMPQKDSIRIEEMINYFDYDYAVPESKSEPFKPTVAVYETPWNEDTMLMHVGIKGHEMDKLMEKPKSNLVFLIDTSGSMSSQDKLPLLQQAFRMLVNTLDEDSTVSIVTYAGSAGVVLEPTSASEKSKILNAIDNLRSGGSTAGAQGIRTAYQLAEESFVKDGVNRVFLATDGDFNVGITDKDELKKYIEKKRDTGVYLSVLGFGRGNYNDALMQALAQNGNGNAAYIDSVNEARKVLVDEATSTLYPIANDVKIQIEFNPAQVAEYRLIGYETRLLNREDFNNDKIDAGDIGAGHTVTAIYELTPVGSKAQMIDDLRYGKKEEAKEEAPAADASPEFAFLKMRYKLPGEKTSKLIERPILPEDKKTLDQLSDDIRFAGSVAAFGQLLKGESYVQDFTYNDVLELAQPAKGADPFNYRGEFIGLVRNAEALADK